MKVNFKKPNSDMTFDRVPVGGVFVTSDNTPYIKSIDDESSILCGVNLLDGIGYFTTFLPETPVRMVEATLTIVGGYDHE